MSYNPFIVDGATGISNSTPVVIATDQSYYLPCVHGGVNLSNIAQGATWFGLAATGQSYQRVKLLNAASGNYLYITSFQVANSGYTGLVELASSSDGTTFKQHMIIGYTATTTVGMSFTFSVPLRLPLNSSLYFGPLRSSTLGATGTIANQIIYASAQGNTFTV